MGVLLCRCIPHRYFVVLLCFILMLINVGFRACFALMATDIAFVNISGNFSREERSIFPDCTVSGSKVVDWSGSTVSSFNTAYFAGQFVMSIPAGALVMKFSPKRTFGLVILFSSILLLLLPVATNTHVAVTFIIRTIQGMLDATAIPAMNAVISVWAPRSEKARLINVAYAGVYLSPAVAMFAAGATSCYVSWDSILYIYGSLGAAWCIPWLVFVASTPEKLSRVVNKKKSPQDQPKDDAKKANTAPIQPIPWCKLFTSLPVMAIWVAAFCRNFIFGLLVTEVQQYFKDVYDLPPSMIGLMSGVPQVFMVIFMLAGAYVFDVLVKKEILSVTNSRKLAQCSGFGIQGLFTLAVGFIDDYVLAGVFLCIGAAFNGFAISGYQTNILDLAPQYTGPLTGISRTGMLGSVISTTLVTVLTGDSHSLVDWQHVFIIAGGVHIAGVIFYGIFASGNVQPWAMTEIKINIPTAVYSETSPDSKTPAPEYCETTLDDSIPTTEYCETLSEKTTPAEEDISITSNGKLGFTSLQLNQNNTRPANGYHTPNGDAPTIGYHTPNGDAPTVGYHTPNGDTPVIGCHTLNGDVTSVNRSNIPNGFNSHYLPSSVQTSHSENIPDSDSSSLYIVHL